MHVDNNCAVEYATAERYVDVSLFAKVAENRMIERQEGSDTEF